MTTQTTEELRALVGKLMCSKLVMHICTHKTLFALSCSLKFSLESKCYCCQTKYIAVSRLLWSFQAKRSNSPTGSICPVPTEIFHTTTAICCFRPWFCYPSWKMAKVNVCSIFWHERTWQDWEHVVERRSHFLVCLIFNCLQSLLFFKKKFTS